MTPEENYENTVAVIRDLAANEALASEGGRNNPALVARAILNSGTYDRDGKLQTAGFNADWGGYNFSVSPSPLATAPGEFGRYQATYEWEIEPGLRAGTDGVYLDSIVNLWTAIGNYRREHLAASLHPLTYSPVDPLPAQLGVWNHYEFVNALSDDLHGRGKLLMANIFPHNWVFFAHRLDVMGHEVWTADPPEKMREDRTLAYHKPYCWLMQVGPEVREATREQWMREAMGYGIFPNIVGGTMDVTQYERFRPLFKRYMPTILALAKSGWEPVTYAKVTASPSVPVVVERFGDRQSQSDGRGLYFTLRNEGSDAASVNMVVDTQRLGIVPVTRADLLPEGTALTIDDDGNISLMMAGNSTVANTSLVTTNPADATPA